jgi:hypothetical protein
VGGAEVSALQAAGAATAATSHNRIKRVILEQTCMTAESRKQIAFVNGRPLVLSAVVSGCSAKLAPERVGRIHDGVSEGKSARIGCAGVVAGVVLR